MQFELYKGPVLQSIYDLAPKVSYVWLDKCIYEINSTEIESYLNLFKKDIVQESGIYSDTAFNSTENFFRFRLFYKCKYKNCALFKR